MIRVNFYCVFALSFFLLACKTSSLKYGLYYDKTGARLKFNNDSTFEYYYYSHNSEGYSYVEIPRFLTPFRHANLQLNCCGGRGSMLPDFPILGLHVGSKILTSYFSDNIGVHCLLPEQASKLSSSAFSAAKLPGKIR